MADPSTETDMDWSHFRSIDDNFLLLASMLGLFSVTGMLGNGATLYVFSHFKQVQGLFFLSSVFVI